MNYIVVEICFFSLFNELFISIRIFLVFDVWIIKNFGFFVIMLYNFFDEVLLWFSDIEMLRYLMYNDKKFVCNIKLMFWYLILWCYFEGMLFNVLLEEFLKFYMEVYR